MFRGLHFAGRRDRVPPGISRAGRSSHSRSLPSTTPGQLRLLGVKLHPRARPFLCSELHSRHTRLSRWAFHGRRSLLLLSARRTWNELVFSSSLRNSVCDLKVCPGTWARVTMVSTMFSRFHGRRPAAAGGCPKYSAVSCLTASPIGSTKPRAGCSAILRMRVAKRADPAPEV